MRPLPTMVPPWNSPSGCCSKIWYWPGGSPSGDPGGTVSHYRSSVAINKQSQRSLVNWSESTEIPEMKASSVRRLFNVSTLTGGR